MKSRSTNQSLVCISLEAGRSVLDMYTLYIEEYILLHVNEKCLLTCTSHILCHSLQTTYRYYKFNAHVDLYSFRMFYNF